MKRYIKLILIILITLILLPTGVYAHSAADGNTATYGKCDNSYDWCYSGIGIRFSLYTYKNNTLNYLGSVDYDASPSSLSLKNRAAKISTAEAGKVAYRENKKRISWSTENYKLEFPNKKFSCFYNCGNNNFGDDLKPEILEQFGLNESAPNEDTVRKKINNFFDTNISKANLQYAYITVEPTMYIYNKSGDAYFGTIYELLNLSDTTKGKSFFGLNELLYATFPNSIVASNASAKDTNNFVGSKINSLVKLVGSSFLSVNKIHNSSNYYRKTNRDKIVGKQGYGIGVFWVGEKFNPKCKSICSDKTGNNLLICAEDFCSDTKKYTTRAKKEECINSCGYKKPADTSCGNGYPKTTPAPAANCSGDVTASYETCGSNTYFKRICKETTTVTFSDLTGKNGLYVGDEKTFSYSIPTLGTKLCTREFNKDLFQYDYAIRVTDLGRQTLLDSVTSDPFFKTKDTNKFPYNAEKTAWNIKQIKNDKTKSKGETLTWKSISNRNSIQNPKTDNVLLIKNGKKTEKTYYVKKQYESINTGDLSISSIHFNTNKAATYNSEVKIQRTTSGLNSTSICDYTVKRYDQPSEEISCSAEKLHDGKIEYTIEYKFAKDKTSGFKVIDLASSTYNVYYRLGDQGDYSPLRSNVITDTVQTLNLRTENGTTTSCSIPTVVETCNINVRQDKEKGKVFVSASGTNIDNVTCKLNDEPLPLQQNGGEIDISTILSEDNPYEEIICKATLNSGGECDDKLVVGGCEYIPPAKKDKINKFCDVHYGEAGYSSSNNCKTECGKRSCPSSTEDCGGKTCSLEEIINWCRTETNWKEAGYSDKYACINDCGPTGNYGPYIFRPITLGKTLAFPKNRQAGANWLGIEEKLEESVVGKDPLYTITLNSDSIKRIKDNTNKLSKGEAYMPYEQLSSDEKKTTFKSEFLEDYISFMKEGEQ